MRLILLLLLMFPSVCFGQMKFSTVFASRVPEVTKNQILIQKHLYLAAVEKEYRQPAWVAYRVNRADWDTDNVLERNFNTPPEMREFCLEESDYRESGYDLGHMYGLQFVSANRYASEVNQLCAIAAQRPELNRGPWLKGENKIKALSYSSEVTVITGLLWNKAMPGLKNSDEKHRIASHCWMLFTDGTEEHAYLFPQDVTGDEPLEKFVIDPARLRAMVSRVWVSGQEN